MKKFTHRLLIVIEPLDIFFCTTLFIELAFDSMINERNEKRKKLLAQDVEIFTKISVTLSCYDHFIIVI
jgi:hypothetical protein